jgi:quercetin dioxygenase-like cupin family protein
LLLRIAIALIGIREAETWPQSSNAGWTVTKDVPRAPRTPAFVGSSHEFVGAEQGHTSVSVFLFHGKPGSGPGPHRHPYDEIQFIREGRGLWTVSDKTFEGSAGDIFVIKAGEIHSFKAVGDSPLVQLDIHLRPRFIQEDL